MISNSWLKKGGKTVLSAKVMKSLYATFSITTFVLFIFSLAFEDNRHPYAMSSIVFVFLSIIFALTAYFYENFGDNERWIMPGGHALIVGWFLLFVTLLVRLVSFKRYHSSLFAFDFGPKNCLEVDILNTTEKAVKCESEHSYSFTFYSGSDAFNTMGHTFQGFLVICMFCKFRYYVTDHLVKMLHGDQADNNVKDEEGGTEKRQYEKYSDSFVNNLSSSERYFVKISRTFDILLLVVWVYPLYNAIKRIHKHFPTFSTSSFGNNALEWAIGFLFGTSIGFLIELYGRNVSSHRQKVMMNSSFSGPILRHYDSDVLLKALDPECKGISVYEKRWHRSRLVSGVLLIITSILAIVFYIITWGFAVEDKATTTDGNDNAIQEALAIISILFVFLPCLMCMLVPLCVKEEILHKEYSLKALSRSLSAIDVLDVAISDEGKTAEVYSHTNI